MKASALSTCVLLAATSTVAVAQPGDSEGTAAPVAMSTTAKHERRPEGFSTAIGAGYLISSGVDLMSPNISSVRFRLETGLTIEPFFQLWRNSSTTDTGAGESSSSGMNIGVGAMARHPLHSRGRVDFVAVGGLRLERTSSDPDGDDNNSSTMEANLLWGLGLDYWVNPNWLISLTGINSLVAYEKTTTELGPSAESSMSTSGFGIVFDPTVLAMVHVHF